MTRQQFEICKAEALRRIDEDWERAWRDKRHVKLRHDADFNGGVPGGLVIELIERERPRNSGGD
jgi:hypothetical protein